MSTLLPDSVPEAGGLLAGCWSAGERLLQLHGKPLWVNVWFHLFEGGEAIISMRYLDQPPSRVHGRWHVEGDQLVAWFGDGEIRAGYALDDDVLRWAGETLLRLSDSTASLAFGIQLPYHLTLGGPVALA
jgi:hypothetical protein